MQKVYSAPGQEDAARQQNAVSGKPGLSKQNRRVKFFAGQSAEKALHAIYLMPAGERTASITRQIVRILLGAALAILNFEGNRPID